VAIVATPHVEVAFVSGGAVECAANAVACRFASHPHCPDFPDSFLRKRSGLR